MLGMWKKFTEKAFTSFASDLMLKLDIDSILAVLAEKGFIDRESVSQISGQIKRNLEFLRKNGEKERQIVSELVKLTVHAAVQKSVKTFLSLQRTKDE